MYSSPIAESNLSIFDASDRRYYKGITDAATSDLHTTRFFYADNTMVKETTSLNDVHSSIKWNLNYRQPDMGGGVGGIN